MSTKRKSSGGKFAPPVVKSTVRAPKTTIDESRAAVSATDSIQAALRGQQPETIEISSDEESEEDVSDEEMKSPDAAAESGEATEEAVNGTKEDAAATNKQTQPKTDAEGADAESDDEAGSPTFGDLLRGTIDVPAILSQQEDPNKAVAPVSRKNLAAPSLSSLSTVLTQALKTEDTDLLESCLQVTNLATIQQTIERLDSSLAGILLTKLAARFHRRPGRAGSLMAWVKWTLIAHGGALAIQPKVLDRLVALQKVLNERSRGLPSLLALKGKLDMLDAQMQLRNGRTHRRRSSSHREHEDNEEDDDEDEAGVLYVEGEEDEEADLDAANGVGRKAILGGEDDEEEDEETVPTANGFVGDSDDDDDEEDVAGVEDESSGEEEVDEDEVDHDDVDDSMDDDDDSDAEAAPPAKVQKTAPSFAKRK